MTTNIDTDRMVYTLGVLQTVQHARVHLRPDC